MNDKINYPSYHATALLMDELCDKDDNFTEVATKVVLAALAENELQPEDHRLPDAILGEFVGKFTNPVDALMEQAPLIAERMI